jgi:hypothetical protein
MSKHEKFLQRLMSGQAGTDIDFDDLYSLLIRHGFQVRKRGDHHIFTKEGVLEIINLQPVNGKAKSYQVKQVRNLLRNYHLDDENK